MAYRRGRRHFRIPLFERDEGCQETFRGGVEDLVVVVVFVIVIVIVSMMMIEFASLCRGEDGNGSPDRRHGRRIIVIIIVVFVIGVHHPGRCHRR